MGTDEDNSSLIDVLENNTPRVDSNLIDESHRRYIHDVLKTLPQRDCSIMMMHFGIDRNFPLLTSEIALRLNLSYERVRKIIEHSIKVLREGPYRALLLSCIA